MSKVDTPVEVPRHVMQLKLKRKPLPKQIKHWFQKANLGRFSYSGYFADLYHFSADDKHINRIIGFELRNDEVKVVVYWKHDTRHLPDGHPCGYWLVGLFPMPKSLKEFLEMSSHIKSNIKDIEQVHR